MFPQGRPTQPGPGALILPVCIFLLIHDEKPLAKFLLNINGYLFLINRWVIVLWRVADDLSDVLKSNS